MYAMSPLRNAGVFEALLRLSCMACLLGVHGGRSTWKTADRSRKSNNSQAKCPRDGLRRMCGRVACYKTASIDQITLLSASAHSAMADRQVLSAALGSGIEVCSTRGQR